MGKLDFDSGNQIDSFLNGARMDAHTDVTGKAPTKALTKGSRERGDLVAVILDRKTQDLTEGRRKIRLKIHQFIG